ncbi:MAG: alpha/beta fold hydrolase [Candidatus Obscuribacterales bacterium]|jgi:pimeloyl-ACP methyl ester carboxylesterase
MKAAKEVKSAKSVQSITPVKPISLDKFPGMICRGYSFDAPLDYGNSAGAKISIFAREVVSLENAEKPGLPWLFFLQGGPGFQSPRPENLSGWMKRAARDFRILLIDQRGTGLSTPVTEKLVLAYPTAQEQFEYLKHFRADNIVRDCELIRKSLCQNEKVTLLGQSFGGFCSTTYLSIAPEGLSGAILTGGLPPLVDDADEVYRLTYRELIKKNKLFYGRYPADIVKVAQIVDHLQNNSVFLPTGEPLTVERFLQLGLNFGFNSSGGSMNTVHYMLEGAFCTAANSKKPELTYTFLRDVESQLHFNTNPIYALLHEAIYCQGRASNWSAARMVSEFNEFRKDSSPIFFSGEMVYPWMFEEYTCLKPFKEVAELLASYTDWPPLYDLDRLKQNDVPCVGTIYCNDMYVARQLAEQTAEAIVGMKVWITNEYEHDALRQDGELVLDRLLSMLSDS